MPEQETIERAKEDEREGKAPSTQAGEFVREEIHHVREGKHGARSTKQAIAIGLSKARRAGVKLGTPKRAKASTRKKASQSAAKGRPATERRAAAKKAVKTKGPAKRKAAAKKAARTRQRKAS